MRFLDEDDPRRLLWERCESPIEQMVCTMLFADLGASLVPAGHTLREFVTDQPRAFLYAQHRIAGYRLDFLVVVADREGHRAFAIECDGHAYHSSADQQIHDIDRDDDLRRAGVDEVYRFTGYQIVKRTDWVADQITAVLRDYGIEPTPPAELAFYRELRERFVDSRTKRSMTALLRERGQIKRRDNHEEELAAIRRADAMWM